MGTRAMTMEQLPDLPGWATVLGTIGGIATAGWFAFRRMWSTEKVALAGNAAQAQLIELLRTQVEKERQRADFERTRADTERERNTRLMATIDTQDNQLREMNEKLSDLTIEVARLRAQLNASMPQATP